MKVARETSTGLEQRIADLERRIEAVARHTAELEDLRKEVGNLKIEVEQMREE